ncbi:MAG TPA: glucose 1-dehydrogenase [Spirochaetia bacterium]|nr:glucose 1-dehydrogenase [Spirochaetia bacterium]
MEERLRGKIAVVAGAGSGIGRGVARRLAEEGATVVVVDLNAEGAERVAAEIAKTGRTSSAHSLDISKPEKIKELAARVAAQLGRIDIFVNTAGLVQSKLLLDVTENDWDRIVDVNQKGTAFAAQAFGEQMIRQVPEEVKRAGRADTSYGKIVNFSSISGRRGREYQLAYAASKAAVISITQSAALAFAPYGINVNAIAPSVVMTPMWDQNNREKERAFGVDSKKASDEFIARIPLKRPGTVEDMAGAVAFLCSSDSDYITGQTLNVDGGFEMD